MLAWRSWRVLLVALVPVFVFPLYGQTSCNRACPPSPNPCERTIGRSSATGQCVYTNFNGADCDYQGAAGSCFNGECLPAECAGIPAFGICDLGDGSQGICMDFECVATSSDDACLKPGVGRINCCSDAGCSVASGAYCNDPVDNGTSCDPNGVERAGVGQGGLCIEGTCVALSGDCNGVECPTLWESQCAAASCNPQTGECQELWVATYTECLDADSNAPGFCRNGECREVNDECDSETCVSGPCTVATCAFPCSFTVPGCTVDDYLNETPSCYRWNRPNGDRCVGDPGTCFNGGCALGPCENDSECDDGNLCTVNTCNPFGGLCDTDPLQDGTSCAENQDGQVLARCENGQCLPDLCLNRDCGDPDGNPCTGVCISPYGICLDDQDLPDGATCPGGQCLFGNCEPILTSECDHQPFDPDREFAECDDGKECTYDRCDFADQCINPRKPNGTSCNNGNGSCIFGGCAINGGGGGLGL